MSFHTDPIRLYRRRLAVIVVTGIAALALTAVAMWRSDDDANAPSWTPCEPAERVAAPTARVDSHDRSLDIAQFTAQLWNPAPPSPPPPPQTELVDDAASRAPARPPNLVLIAITVSGSDRMAAVFDPQTNELLMLRTGDEVQGFAIESIGERAVLLTRGAGTHQLALIPQGAHP